MSGPKAILRNAAVLTEEELRGVRNGKVCINELAKKYGKHWFTMKRWLAARGVEETRNGAAMWADRQLDHWEMVAGMVEKIGMRPAAKELGLSHQRVWQIVKKWKKSRGLE